MSVFFSFLFQVALTQINTYLCMIYTAKTRDLLIRFIVIILTGIWIVRILKFLIEISCGSFTLLMNVARCNFVIYAIYLYNSFIYSFSSIYLQYIRQTIIMYVHITNNYHISIGYIVLRKIRMYAYIQIYNSFDNLHTIMHITNF